MTKTLPIWSLPLVLALVGIAALIGNLGPIVLGIVGVEALAVCVYVVVLTRRSAPARQPLSNLLSLFPGHLLILIMIALLENPDGLAWLWTITPLATLAYDAVGRTPRLATRTRVSISMILYGILWADLFFLLERAVILHRQITGNREVMIAVGFGLVGALFLLLGVYRHRIAAKE